MFKKGLSSVVASVLLIVIVLLAVGFYLKYVSEKGQVFLGPPTVTTIYPNSTGYNNLGWYEGENGSSALYDWTEVDANSYGLSEIDNISSNMGSNFVISYARPSNYEMNSPLRIGHRFLFNVGESLSEISSIFIYTNQTLCKYGSPSAAKISSINLYIGNLSSQQWVLLNSISNLNPMGYPCESGVAEGYELSYTLSGNLSDYVNETSSGDFISLLLFASGNSGSIMDEGNGFGYGVDYIYLNVSIVHAPIVNLISPLDASVTNSMTNYFYGNFTDQVELTNATLYVWNSTSLIGTNFIVLSGKNAVANLSLSLPRYDTYYWNYYVGDEYSDYAWNSTNFTLIYSSEIGEICGNNICGGGETCSSCSGDCGDCGGSGGGGGGGCTWACNSWSLCINNEHSRSCVSSCGSTRTDIEACTIGGSEPEAGASGNLFISMATLQNEYILEEMQSSAKFIQLTDPPEDVVEGTPESTDEAFVEEFNEPVVKENSDLPKVWGYEVMFEEEPYKIYEWKVNESANKNKEYVQSLSALNPIKYVYPIFVTMPNDVEGKVGKRKDNLAGQHIRIKKLIADKLDYSSERLKFLYEHNDYYNGALLLINESEAEKIRYLPGVKLVAPNELMEPMLMDSVDLIDANSAWEFDAWGGNCADSGNDCLTGRGINIAIIDTGINYNHPDFGGCTQDEFLNGVCEKVIGGRDVSGDMPVGFASDVIPDDDPMDNDGHGTHVASTAAGKGLDKNGNGIFCEYSAKEFCGVAPDARILAYKVFPNSYNVIVNDAVIQALNDGADIISMSLGRNCGIWEYNADCGPDDFQSIFINNIVDTFGIPIVVAAGNEGNAPYVPTITSPGTARGAITVGATWKKDYNGVVLGEGNPRRDTVAGFSSVGPVSPFFTKPDVVAPGALICAARYSRTFVLRSPLVTCVDKDHILIDGTSMATPHVAGAIALLMQANPDWDAERIRTELVDNALDLGVSRDIQGAGRIQVMQTLNRGRGGNAFLPQSKLVNRGDEQITGTLTLRLEKMGGTWLLEREVFKGPVTLDPHSVLKLDYIWNNQMVTASTAGKYRVFAQFVSLSTSEVVDASWEFTVKPYLAVYSPEKDMAYRATKVPMNISFYLGRATSIQYNKDGSGWTNFCSNCANWGYTSKKTLTLSEGYHTIDFRADYLDKIYGIPESISFIVDSKAPKIISTYPKAKGFTNGLFNVSFIESNPVNVEFLYKISTAPVSAPYDRAIVDLASCTLSGTIYTCVIKIDLPTLKYGEGTKIKLKSNVDSVSGLSTVSAEAKDITIDTISPVVESVSAIKVGTLPPYRKFKISVSVGEINLANGQYLDSTESPSRWKTLCTSLVSGVCSKTVSFVSAPVTPAQPTRTISLRFTDKAGNSANSEVVLNYS